MAFLSGFVSYALRFILFAAVAMAGLVCGKKLRENKDASK